MIVVDRIEGSRAVLDIAGETVDVPLAALPPNVKEGSQLRFDVVPTDLTSAQAQLERLRARTPTVKGDIDL